MALNDYEALKAAVARTLRRDDLAGDIPDFIALAEGKMNRRLRVRRMIGRATASLADEYSAVPMGYLGVRTFSIDASPPRALRFVTPDRMDELAGRPASGTPECFTVAGDEFRYWPAPSGAGVTGRLTYWRAIPALSGADFTNWVLQDHPDAYLYGALTASAPFLKADERLATWGGLFMAALEEIEAADRTESFSAALSGASSSFVA